MLKLTDFGLSAASEITPTNIGKSRISTGTFGTVRWLAPECLAQFGSVSEKSDVYALGIFLWELLAREIPYESVADDYEVMRMVKNEDQT